MSRRANLVIIILVGIAGVILLALGLQAEFERPSSPSMEKREARAISIGIEGEGYQMLETRDIQLFVHVNDGSTATANLSIDLVNIGNTTVSPTIVFALPKDAKNILDATTRSELPVKTTNHSRFAFIKSPDAVAGGGTFAAVTFEWPNFASELKPGLFHFTLEGTTLPTDAATDPDLINRFHTLIQPIPGHPFGMIESVSVNAEKYVIDSFSPSAGALDYRNSIGWRQEDDQLLFMLEGTYQDSSGALIPILLTGLGFTFIGISVGMLVEKATREKKGKN